MENQQLERKRYHRTNAILLTNLAPCFLDLGAISDTNVAIKLLFPPFKGIKTHDLAIEDSES